MKLFLGNFWRGLSAVKQAVVVALFFVTFGFMAGMQAAALWSLPQNNKEEIQKLQDQVEQQGQDIMGLRSDFREFRSDTDDKLDAIVDMVANQICRQEGRNPQQCDWRETHRRLQNGKS